MKEVLLIDRVNLIYGLRVFEECILCACQMAVCRFGCGQSCEEGVQKPLGRQRIKTTSSIARREPCWTGKGLKDSTVRGGKA